MAFAWNNVYLYGIDAHGAHSQQAVPPVHLRDPVVVHTADTKFCVTKRSSDHRWDLDETGLWSDNMQENMQMRADAQACIIT